MPYIKRSPFTAVESGRKNDRPQLHAALQACKKHKAQLVIAKLDRLARNVAFISGMMESETAFVAVDMPQANRFMLHILAAVAEYEREMISQRIIEAMAVAKSRGVKMGNPCPFFSAWPRDDRRPARSVLPAHAAVDCAAQG